MFMTPNISGKPLFIEVRMQIYRPIASLELAADCVRLIMFKRKKTGSPKISIFG